MNRKALLLLIVVGFAASFISRQVIGETNPPPNAQVRDIERRLQSKDWNIRLELASQLTNDHRAETFNVLLELLKDKHLDVSYAAVEAIELRGDGKFDKELIEATKVLPRENRWPVYRAEKNYRTKRMMDFLFGCLQDEIQFYRKMGNFDERNSFYLAGSLQIIAQSLLKADTLKAPEYNKLASYEKFAADFKRLLSTENASK